MRRASVLAEHTDFTVCRVVCTDDHRRWSAVEQVTGHGVVLVTAGGFRRSGSAGETMLDRTLGYVAVPGEEERFAHPAGGDVCTSVQLSPALWRELRGDAGAGPPSPLYVDARLELAHRLLLRRAAGADLDFAAAERLVRMLGPVLARPAGPAATPADRVAAEAAREAVLAGDPAAAGLLPLARRLGLSPYRLSRAFQRATGVPLTRFRNRVRVGEALARLEQGERSLARLAAELGFADQAHLARTVRAHVGQPPARLRRLWHG